MAIDTNGNEQRYWAEVAPNVKGFRIVYVSRYGTDTHEIAPKVAPPVPEGVTIPRDLAERAVEALSVHGHMTESMEVIQQAHTDAEAIRAILDGSAT